jgi:hypothetical protein
MFHEARPAVFPSDAAPTLRVVIFYSDLPAADRALRAVRTALQRQSDARRIEPMLWNTSLLAEAQWLRLAAADVAHAELCILSLGANDQRANDANAWLAELAPRLANHWVTLTPFEDPAQNELLRLAV